MKPTVDYLIIGQGIAGSLLAFNLLDRGLSIRIIDDGYLTSSSYVSVGMINPISGQRLKLVPQFDQFIDCALKQYHHFEQLFNQRFFTPKSIIRIIKDEAQLAYCQQLMEGKGRSYIDGIYPSGHWGSVLKDPFGTMVINSGGYCQTQELLRQLRQFFLNRGVLIEGDASLRNSIDASHTIWCDGFRMQELSFLNHLPFNMVKGEIIQFNIKGAVLPDAIITSDKWCIPEGNGLVTAGATYDRDDLTMTVTDQGCDQIIAAFSNMFDLDDVTVIHQRAGVRPVVIDQNPVIGLLTDDKNTGVFNGLGSKGFLCAPYFAKLFVEHLLDKKDLPKQIDVNRFKQT